MTIYAIRKDGYKYQELDLEINDVIDNFPDQVSYDQAHDFSLENLSMKDFWPNIKTGFSKIEGRENLIPDITIWVNATLVLSPTAYRYLGDLLSPFGEFLPVHIGDDLYQIFNCRSVAEASPGSNERKLLFDENKVSEQLVFKSPLQHCIDVFCGDKLKSMTEDFDLNGVVFDKRLSSPFT